MDMDQNRMALGISGAKYLRKCDSSETQQINPKAIVRQKLC